MESNSDLEKIIEYLNKLFEPDSPPNPVGDIYQHTPHRYNPHFKKDKQIWRYMDFQYFKSLIERSQLFFASPASYPDPYERYYPHSGDSEFEKAISKFVLSNVYLSCWHQNDAESMGMWNLYTKPSTGVAIRSSFQSLKESLITPAERTLNEFSRELYFGGVRYSHQQQPFKLSFGKGRSLPTQRLDPLFKKRQGYGHEDEIRAVLDLSRTTKRPADQDSKSNGCFVDIDTVELIEEVVVHPNCDSGLHSRLAVSLERNNLDPDLAKISSLAEKQLDQVIEVK
jgi:hypothetical protein